MSPRTLSLIRLSGALSTRDPERIRGAMEEGRVRCDPDQIEEILLQAYLFLGFPAALNGLSLWRELSGRSAPLSRGESPDLWSERGEEVCRGLEPRQESLLVGRAVAGKRGGECLSTV